MHSFFLPTYICLLISVASALASSPTTFSRSILVTGANKGQGKALCERILTEHDDTRVFLCSRDTKRGEEAAASLRKLCADGGSERVQVIQLDVTSPSSVSSAAKCVQESLGPDGKLFGVVSNAGILWGYSLPELIDVCSTGVRRVVDEFLPLMEQDGRIIVVSSGLGPLMHGYSSEERQNSMMDPSCTWDGSIEPMIQECLNTYQTTTAEDRPSAFEQIGFPGGPFAEAAPDFHMYGLSKMFADAYMRSLARSFPKLRITSVDPGLVYTDLILKMDRYKGKEISETGAQTPHQGVEATMRLLFDSNAGSGDTSGQFYAMSKDKTELLHSDINKMPNK
mmetsp:Transcript_24786/g.34959  ORF Transcript_24786/g.34959 Transcript_24786/m.34959 type:complete len:338 (-) Transcript_24786:219-1232(-)